MYTTDQLTEYNLMIIEYHYSTKLFTDPIAGSVVRTIKLGILFILFGEASYFALKQP